MTTETIKRRSFIKLAGCQIAALSLLDATSFAAKSGKPNFVVIFIDDMGYGDLACYGSERNRTPNVDQMAAEGVKFTDFYSACSVCTPSRAALLTGCYPMRIGMAENSVGKCVLFPAARKGLNPDETTIADLLKTKGYSTACIGKWHLGDHPKFLPTKQGFDYYYGIPYSNDMGRGNIPLPLMRNEEVIEAPVNQDTLTKRYTEESLKFIDANQDKPFFLYLPHSMVHTPLHASDGFRGKSENGIYGDAVEEVDWSTGEILKKLEELGIAENTLVIFTSDNGSNRRNGGRNDPLRGKKGQTWEGGMRVPSIAWYPDRIPAGRVCDAVASTIDILPTIAHLADAQLPQDRIIDGKNIWKLMTHPDSESPHEAFYYYQRDQLQCVRSGKWKLHLPLEHMKWNWGGLRKPRPMKLYNLEKDIHEDHDVSKQHPEVVERLMKLADRIRKDIGDYNVEGENQRPAGRVENGSPRLMEKD